MTWRRGLFWIVYGAAWFPLWLMFVIGFLAEGLQQRVERFDAWSRGMTGAQ